MSDWFRRAAHEVTLWSGSWQFFVLSVVGVIAWAALGPPMTFSDTWQLIVNTPTTVLTYLIGILILMEANRASRESKIVHDELLRAVREARTELINVDELTEEELDRLQEQLKRRAAAEATAE
ncbi:MAG TPA: low affinity iron permease family protein [candidate division Zixibacteria bacterium]|nr:low affinity iron permease family protein [candidate division Zixibacteria bacterium]